MMNLRKKSKKTILSSLIALALSSSMAFAMPQGGSVVAGNVNGVTSGSLANLASGDTLNVNALSLIDWKSFNIGENETLNVIFNGGNHGNMLINHVTGGDISRLMGILNSGTNGNFWLINPAGIVVGKDAQFNVGGLVLSTLDVSNNDLMGLMVSGGDPTLKWEKTKEGVLDIQGGKFNVTDMLSLVGGKIQIADGVTISAGDTDSTSIIAANSFVMAEKNGKTNIINCNMDESNVLSFNNANVNVTGGALSAMAGKINFANSTVSVKDGAFRLAAVNKVGKWNTDNFDISGVSATRQNAIKLNNSTLEAAFKNKPEDNENKTDKGRLYVTSAVLEMDGSTVKADDRVEISTAEVSASEKNSITFKPVVGSEVTLRNSTISGGDVAVVSNKISLQGNSQVTIGKDDRFLVMGAGSNVKVMSGDSIHDKDTYTRVEADGKIAISQKTYDNLVKAGVMSFVKGYVIVDETAEQNTSIGNDASLIEKIEGVIGNASLTEAQKAEKVKEVFGADATASALMTTVRGQVDSATNAAPQTSTAIPAANSVESANVAAGEGVMSSDKSSVKGVEKK